MSDIERQNSKYNSLGRRQYRALKALIEYPSVEAAAKASGIGASTIRRYLSDDAFRAALIEIQDQALELSFGRLATRSSSAVEALERALTCGVYGVEARAALGYLSLLHKRTEAKRYQKMEEEVQRLAALVEQLDGA